MNRESYKQRYKDSNLEMTESESVALPFGDTAICYFQQKMIIADACR